jgi:hypothetical protein
VFINFIFYSDINECLLQINNLVFHGLVNVIRWFLWKFLNSGGTRDPGALILMS